MIKAIAIVGLSAAWLCLCALWHQRGHAKGYAEGYAKGCAEGLAIGKNIGKLELSGPTGKEVAVLIEKIYNKSWD